MAHIFTGGIRRAFAMQKKKEEKKRSILCDSKKPAEVNMDTYDWLSLLITDDNCT